MLRLRSIRVQLDFFWVPGESGRALGEFTVGSGLFPGRFWLDFTGFLDEFQVNSWLVLFGSFVGSWLALGWI